MCRSLRGDDAAAGRSWLAAVLDRSRAACAGRSLSLPPSELALAAGLRLRAIDLPDGGGAYLRDVVWLPTRGGVRRRRLICAHLVLRAIGDRLGIALPLADWWVTTAAVVLCAATTPAGVGLYPRWAIAAAECGKRG